MYTAIRSDIQASKQASKRSEPKRTEQNRIEQNRTGRDGTGRDRTEPQCTGAHFMQVSKAHNVTT